MNNAGSERRFQNLEGLAEFDVCLHAGVRAAGVSAMLRVKNEASKIRGCLASILDVFDQIVVVDNGSDDGTGDVVRAFTQEHDAAGKIQVFQYPFQVARCGPEHDATPEHSVHSLAHYYNWALARCTRRYVCKWDADMVARREERVPFRHFLEQLQDLEARVVTIQGQTVYQNSSGRCFLAADETYAEPRLFPNSGENYYVKVRHFESIHLSPALPKIAYDGVVFYELKFVGEDEFSHWSTSQFPTKRKQQEWQHFESLRTNVVDPDGLMALPDTFLSEQCRR